MVPSMVWPRLNWRALTDASNIDGEIFFLLAHNQLLCNFNAGDYIDHFRFPGV